VVEHTEKKPDDQPGEAALLRVLEEVADQRFRGEHVPDESVIASHPELMPELARMLHHLRLTESARNGALASTNSDGSDDNSSSWGLNRERRGPVIERPDALPGYELLGVIGRGGMGVVYRARHTATQREVAIKVMGAACLAEPMDQARFEREARILISLRHPNIVTVYDTGLLPPPVDVEAVGTIGRESAGGRFYLVMDYISGDPLDRFITAAKPDLSALLELFAKVCDAVNAAHLKGVIHRDLKPSNILVTRLDPLVTPEKGTPPVGVPHLLDFGLATFTQPEGGDAHALAATMTMTGQFVGSLPWASPEQAESVPGKIDVRSDVYSLGVILHHMLSGRFPYPVVGNIRDIVDNILTRDPEPLSRIAPQVDNEVETIVLKCLSKDRDRRYQSAGDVAKDIRRYLDDEPIEAKRDSGWYVLRKGLRRHRAAVAVSVAFVALVLAFGVTMTVLYRQEQREADRARQTLAFLGDVLFQASSHRLGSDATLAEMLDHASERVATDFAGLPESEALLRYTIGSAYETIWRKEEAVEHLRASLALYRQTKGPSDPETLRCMVLLGMVLAELGEPQAVELEQEALATRRALYGEHHALVADSMGELAFALWTTQVPPRWSEAEDYYQRALAIYEETIGPEHPDIARTLHAFAAMRDGQGRLAESDKLYARSLAMSRKLLGDDHQFVAECMRDYAVVLSELDRFDEAEAMLCEVERRTARLFGRAWVPEVRYQLARVLLQKGDLSEAQRLVQDALADKCRYLATLHPERAERLTRLAALLGSGESFGADAVSEAVDVTCDITHDLRRSLHFTDLLADILGRRDGAVAAEPLLRANVQTAERWFVQSGDEPKPGQARDRYYRGLAHARLGECLLELKRSDEAIECLNRGCGILAAELGEDHAFTTRMTEVLNRARQARDETSN